MRVLVACEFSGIVRDAFTKKGHDAWSCDLLPTESEGNHIQDSVVFHLEESWDLMIAHPPCTHISYAGIRWWNEPNRMWKRLEALDFFARLWEAPIPKICIENPMGCASPTISKYSQIIQPYQFGDPESKRTCLWLKNLPTLQSTKIVKPRIYGRFKKGKKTGRPIYGTQYCKFSEDRGKVRSVFFKGIANAMAEQWG